MASVGVSDVLSIAMAVYQMCSDASATKSALKAAQSKMEMLLPILFKVQSDQRAVGPDNVMAPILRQVHSDIERVRNLLQKANKMNKAVYVVRASGIREDLDASLDSVRFSLMALEVCQSDVLSRELHDFHEAWRIREEELREEALQERKEQEQLGKGDIAKNVVGAAGISGREELQEAIHGLKDERDKLHRQLLSSKDDIATAKAVMERDAMEKIIAALELANAGKVRELPDSCLCPISNEVLVDPVIMDSMCKHSCSREAFKRWYGDGHRDCPLCRAPLRSPNVAPNVQLRQVVLDFMHGGVTEGRASHHLEGTDHPASKKSSMTPTVTIPMASCPLQPSTGGSRDKMDVRLSDPCQKDVGIIFHCGVMRSATHLNCPSTLGRNTIEGAKGDDRNSYPTSPPSEKLILEECTVSMPQLADIRDLTDRLQEITGISAHRLKICRVEEIALCAEDKSSTPEGAGALIKVTPVGNGPCGMLAKHLTVVKGESQPQTTSIKIMAFESTLRPRPSHERREDEERCQLQFSGDIAKCRSHDSNAKAKATIGKDEQEEPIARKCLQEHLGLYGDQHECRTYDTDPTPISRAMSRSLWPRSASDFKLGLRVDAVDHRDNWLPGSVVEFIDKEIDNSDEVEVQAVRVHFDKCSSKWDETDALEHFKGGKVRPLYSHTVPRANPTEFLVQHRCSNKSTKSKVYFGQSFYLQCHDEWSTARAGAHILAQVARFLQPPPGYDSAHRRRNVVDSDNNPFGETEMPPFDMSEESRAVISQLIDILVESDRQYVEAAILSSKDAHNSGGHRMHPRFNPSSITSVLRKKLSPLFPWLPFGIYVCTADSVLAGQQSGINEEVPFPFSLVRTIGNYMNARHAIVLHWRLIGRKSRTSTNPNLSYSPLYIPPTVGVHKRIPSLVRD